MKKKTKIFIAQFICFALFFLIARIVFSYFFGEATIWGSLAGGFLAIVASPQFKIFNTDKGEKVYMRWIFMKGVKELNW